MCPPKHVVDVGMIDYDEEDPVSVKYMHAMRPKEIPMEFTRRPDSLVS